MNKFLGKLESTWPSKSRGGWSSCIRMTLQLSTETWNLSSKLSMTKCSFGSEVRSEQSRPDSDQDRWFWAFKGLCFHLHDWHLGNICTFTLNQHWMAPEIFSNEQYTLKADVYSYGIVLWEIASRLPPYTNMKNPHSLMKFVTMENGRPDMHFVDKDCPM